MLTPENINKLMAQIELLQRNGTIDLSTIGTSTGNYADYNNLPPTPTTPEVELTPEQKQAQLDEIGDEVDSLDPIIPESLTKALGFSVPTQLQGAPKEKGGNLKPEDIMNLLQTTSRSYSLDTDAYNIGRFWGMEKGTQGRGLGLAGSIGSFGLGAARDILAGFGMSKTNNYVQDYTRDQLNNPYYTEASQTANSNYLGGLPGFEEGGKILQQQYNMGGQIDPRLKPGEYIEFEIDGKQYSGTIDRIDTNTGELFLK